MKKLLIILFPAIAVLFLTFTSGVLFGRCTMGTTAPLTNETTISEEDMSTQKIIGSKININVASKDDLIFVPGLGAVLAQRIIDYREENGPFSTYEDLGKVSGIGPKKLEQLSEYLTVGG